jgi:hypothetical protein
MHAHLAFAMTGIWYYIFLIHLQLSLVQVHITRLLNFHDKRKRFEYDTVLYERVVPACCLQGGVRNKERSHNRDVYARKTSIVPPQNIIIAGNI